MKLKQSVAWFKQRLGLEKDSDEITAGAPSLPDGLEPNPDYGDLITVEAFANAVKYKAFIDYDGHGYWSDGKRYLSANQIRPSTFTLGLKPEWATHVIWFNR
jgi:hypothetical protein